MALTMGEGASQLIEVHVLVSGATRPTDRGLKREEGIVSPPWGPGFCSEGVPGVVPPEAVSKIFSCLWFSVVTGILQVPCLVDIPHPNVCLHLHVGFSLCPISLVYKDISRIGLGPACEDFLQIRSLSQVLGVRTSACWGDSATHDTPFGSL